MEPPSWRGSISFLPAKHGGDATYMATPSLRVYWPDAHSRAGWADPPNWRRPGLALSGPDGAPLLALSETPSLNGDPYDLQAFRNGMVATYAVLSPAPTEPWWVVARWRAHSNERLEETGLPEVLAELLDAQGRLEAQMTVPARRARAGALLDGARLATAPELTVVEATASGEPRAGGWRSWLLPNAQAWTVSGASGRGFIRAEGGDARSRRPWAGPWSGRVGVEWPAEPWREEQILAPARG